MQEEKKSGGKKVSFGKVKEIWNEKDQPVKEGEELVFDNSAYEMLHRAKVEWPCLSIDILVKERIGQTAKETWFPQHLHTLDPSNVVTDKKGIMKHRQDKFPYTVYTCAGSQAPNKHDNKIYVMKWSEMYKTLRDDDEEVDEDSEEENDADKDPDMRF